MIKLISIAALTSLASISNAQNTSTLKQKPQIRQVPKNSAVGRSVPSGPEKPAAMKAQPIRFSVEMLETGKINPAYAGFFASDVIDVLEKSMAVTKGEFESTADYVIRRDAVLAAKFLGGASISDTFAFVVPVEKGGKYKKGITYEFDADSGIVKLYALPKSSEYLSLNGIGAPDYQTNRRQFKGLDEFTLNSKILSSSTYQGSNAYGATVTVEKTIMSLTGIAANRVPFLNFKRDIIYPNPTVSAQFSMENSRAAAELPSMKALIVMKLSAPYVVYNYKRVEPKRDSPTDISIQEKFLYGDVLGIFYYSGNTGEIFARIPEDFTSAKPAP